MDDVTTVQVPSLNEKQALERVISFAQRFGPLHMDLASHAAFPLVLTADLLYRIWASFLPQLPWTTVSDILLSPLCHEVGYEMYEMDPAIRNLLLRELKDDHRFGEPRLKELAGFLEEYIALNLESHDPEQRDLAEAQHLTALAYIAPKEAAREIASKISNPSQLAAADLLRVATLTETLSQPLQAYSSLLSYARGVERLAHGDRQRASNLLERAFEGKQDLEIEGVTLPRPRRAPEPVRPAEETAPPVGQEIKARGTPTILISYRRADSKAVVDRIRERLTTAFEEGSTFRDLVDIPAGQNFREFIEEAISACDVLLVVIGPEWANATDARGRKRLFDPDDLTRIEIETALSRPGIRVFPVLVMNARMPGREDLPESLHGLLSRNAAILRSGPDFEDDMERLIQDIRQLKGPSEPETVYIPEGSFLMGSPPGEGVPAYETPQHEVFLPAYHIGKYPVTNAQYEEFIRETRYRVTPAMGWDGQRVPIGMENHPVTGATWYEALAYCRWLSQKTGRHYTLPTEAQWEKACRGGRNSMYPWGDEFDPARSNARQSDIASVDNYPAQNDFGCFDLVGNVPQWTSSLWGRQQDVPASQYFYPWKDDGRNDLNASPRIRRVIRGSWFQDYISQARSSARRGYLPGDDCGFRVVLLELAASEFPDTINIGETLVNIGSSASPRVTKRTIKPAAPRPPRLFIGRTEELERLRKMIKAKEAVLIVGPDGIGKSALLQQAANTEEARTMPDGVIWIQGQDETGKPSTLDDLIQRLFDSLYETDPPLNVSRDIAMTYLSQIEALVIVDGLELPSMDLNLLADLLPRSALLVSSTRHSASDPFLSLPLGPLPAGDAGRLFMELAGPSYKSADISMIDSICRLLGSVPLAIAMTTSVLRETNTSLEFVREVLTAARPQAKEESAAGLERAFKVVSLLASEPAAAKVEQKAKIYVSYSRRVGTDRNLAEYLAGIFSARGYDVFIDIQSLKAGEEWTKQIDEGIQTSDFFISLLSEASVESEMIRSEILRADEHRKKNGKPRTLAVQVAYDRGLPYFFTTLLDQEQPILWRSQRDNERVARELVQAMEAALASRTEKRGPRLEETRPSSLPDELASAIASEFPSVRLEAVQQLAELLTSDNPALTLYAREALERMAKEDDSRRVSQAAAQALETDRQSRQGQAAPTGGAHFADVAALVAEAEKAQDRMDYASAIRLYREALEFDPGNSSISNQLEFAERMQKLYTELPREAIQNWRRARSFVAARDLASASSMLNAALDAAHTVGKEFPEAEELLKSISEGQQASKLLQQLKSDFRVEIIPDEGDSGSAWIPGTWTMTELGRLRSTLALMAELMGGNEAFIRNLGGISVQKTDTGTHGGEVLARRVNFSTKGSLSAWTIVHEFAHAWDANSGWRLSRELEKYTGGSTSTVRSLALRLSRNWDAAQNGPENKPGRRGRLPGCNRAGYFYGDKPSGSNWSFNRVEDFAESVAMYLGWERGNDLSEHARNRIVRYTLPNRAKDAFGVEDNWADYKKYFYPEGGNYTRTKRWRFIDDLIQERIGSATRATAPNTQRRKR